MRSVHHAGVVLVLMSVALPGWAHAEPGYAEPPAGNVWVADHAPLEPESHVAELAEEPPAHGSSLRLAVGPVLRVSERVTDAGLGATVDVGAGAVGVRLASNWVRVGSESGLSEYQAELWVDFAEGGRLHPILGAGAGLARLSSAGSGSESYGVGVLRGSLEYVLPVPRADARAAIDLSGHVPAMHARNAPDADPWLLIGARVGVGF